LVDACSAHVAIVALFCFDTKHDITFIEYGLLWLGPQPTVAAGTFMEKDNTSKACKVVR
jgi:hypothetical protein